MNDPSGSFWVGDSQPGDAGWGNMVDMAAPNPGNHSLKVKFAIGFTRMSVSH